MASDSETGILFDIQRFCLHDGPGIRTTVFFKGCNMRCAWCHNPESFQQRPQISVSLHKCVHCGACANACPTGAHAMIEGKHAFLAEKCTLCKACLDVCPAGAIKLMGREFTVAEVMAVLERDKPFYEKSGGGITFSGGEATLQPGFLLALLRGCKEINISTCLETNGMVSPKVLSSLMDYADLFLVDFKLHDKRLLEMYTGTAGELLEGTLQKLAAAKKPVVLRCPVIPGINDTDAFFEAVRSLKARYNNIRDVQIMPYHTIGIDKWASIGLNYSLAHISAPDAATVAGWRQKAGQTEGEDFSEVT